MLHRLSGALQILFSSGKIHRDTTHTQLQYVLHTKYLISQSKCVRRVDGDLLGNVDSLRVDI
jgi:hypothetical protein